MMQVKRALFFITLPLCAIGCFAFTGTVRAQVTPDIVPDNSLGAESSKITTNDPNDFIQGGATRGANLFHSFEKFNIGENRGAYFVQPSGIQNIISRVTGRNLSNINGILGVILGNGNLGNANLFLINPNGIEFGPNARLNMGGSFFASTANSLILDNGLLEFSATNPQAPPLLTVNIPTGLRFRDNPEAIRVQDSGQPYGLSGANGSFPNPTLRVNLGKTLALVGGNVSLEGGVLQAPGGQVELGGLVAEGTVGLNFTDNNLSSLSFPDNVARANVFLNERAGINVITNARGGGSITINAQNIDILGRSLLTAGIASNSGTSNTTAGNITLNATGQTRIDQSRIQNSVNSGSLANSSGNINITTGTLSLTNGSRLDTSTFGNGDAGNLEINTRELIVRDGAQVSASTFGAGNGGNLTVNASEKVELSGGSANPQSATGLFTQQSTTGETGNAGDLKIDTRELIVQNGARVSAGTLGVGNGGNLEINTRELIVRDSAQVSASTSGAGNGGKLTVVNAQKVEVANNAFLRAQATENATGSGGNLEINTRDLIVRDGAQVSASTFGAGNGGNLTVNASEKVELSGGSANSQSATGLFTQQSTTSETGNAGDLKIDTRELIVRDGAFVSTTTKGAGDGGTLSVKADSVQLSNNGGLFAQTEGDGDAKDLTINTRELIVRDGAQVSASTSGAGNGGKLTVVNAQKVEVANNAFLRARAEASATGAAGDLEINTRELIVRDGAQVSASTFGKGNSGNLTVNATEKVELSGGSANPQSLTGLFAQQNAENATGAAGNLKIDTKQLIVRDGAEVSASTFGAGNGGKLTIVNAQKVEVANNAFLRARAEASATGAAGDLEINTRELIVQGGAQVSASTLGKGTGGTLSVKADSVQLSNNGGLFAQTEGDGNAKDLTINTRELIVRDGAQVTASTFGAGNGGDLTVNATEKVELIGFGTSANGKTVFSGLSTQQNNENATGAAGNLKIDTQQLIVRDEAFVSASTLGAGDGGTLTVKADSVQLSSNGSLFAQTEGDGAAGNLTINTRELEVRNGAGVYVQSLAQGNAGNLTIDARSIRLDNNAILTATTYSDNTDPNVTQGNITITARDFVLLRRNSQITANAQGTASGGNINIFTSNLAGSGNSDITANASSGNGGIITIETQGRFGFVPRTREELQRLFPNRELNTDIPRELATSDITAFSQQQTNLTGQVNINAPDVDPSQGLVELPETVIDPTQQVAQNPCQRGVGSTFVITGRGGVPSSPNQAISSDNVRVDLVQPVASTGSSNSATTKKPSTSATVKQIVPAQGWIFNEKGEVVLTAYDPTNTGSQRNWQKPASCAVR